MCTSYNTTMAESGPIGYIVHKMSGKLIHPHSREVPQGTPAVIWASGADTRLQFRFVPMTGQGHFGFIEHVSSGKFLHPESGVAAPSQGTKVVYWPGHNIGCLFAFDELNDRIIHKSGTFTWHSSSGPNYPDNGTGVVLWQGENAGSHFYFADSSLQKISPYPTPTLAGEWKLLHSVLDPIATHTYEITYKIGKTTTKSATQHHEWNVSAGVAFKWFSASAQYKGFAEKTQTETWSEELETKIKIEIPPGPSVVTWQFVFYAEQYGDKLGFQSTILKDTSSLDQPPPLEP